MARSVDRMAEDLTEALTVHAEGARKAVRAAAGEMADEARKMSAPLYGIVIDSRVVHDREREVVEVIVRESKAPGKVLGGRPAAVAAVRRRLDRVAQEAGLDRHR